MKSLYLVHRVCNPNDETYVDDEYCDWFGVTTDAEWYDEMEDMFYDSSGSSKQEPSWLSVTLCNGGATHLLCEVKTAQRFVIK